MSGQYVVVARSATFGPFPTVTAAKAWANHPNRTADLRPAWVVVPLFGGIVLDDEPMVEPHRCDRCGTTYDEASGDGYCGLCPSCADQTEPEPDDRPDIVLEDGTRWDWDAVRWVKP